MKPIYTTLISASELQQHLNDSDLVLFDCRFNLADTEQGQKDYDKGHIPGAIYAHMDHDLSSPITPSSGRHPLPDPQKLITWLRSCGVSNNSQVIVYDASGGAMAVRIWWLMRWLGHDKVALLDGGWPAWERLKGPMTQKVPEPTSGDFQGTVDNSMIVDTDKISNDLKNAAPHWLLLDARTHERYLGEHEPIDPVAGRMPGAVNLPLQDNLDENGCFLPPEQLLNLYQKKLNDTSAERTVCYCGSGVTACHNILAMEIAGLKGAKLYPGSWSEWIRDPKRPVAKGSL